MDRVCVIDYGMGNLWSIESALKFLGAKVVITNDINIISESKKMILPGVGSFYKAMQKINELNLKNAIKNSINNNNNILGICLGMQLLSEKGFEDGECNGLGLIPAETIPLRGDLNEEIRIPHVGFNSVEPHKNSILFKNIISPCDFYFVHSYYLSNNVNNGIKTFCNYGHKFLAAYENKNVFATQFHPEKSQTNGLLLLKNFLALK